MIAALWTALTVSGLFALLFIRMLLNRSAKPVSKQPVPADWSALHAFVRSTIEEVLYDGAQPTGLPEQEWDDMRRQRGQLKWALRTCAGGQSEQKLAVKRWIAELLETRFDWTDDAFETLIPFQSPHALSAIDRFDILLHIYRIEYAGEAFQRLLEQVGIDGVTARTEALRLHYLKVRPRLQFADKLAVVTQRVYQYWKGLGVIDELREMKIDGVSGGVSGIPSSWGYLFQDEVEPAERRRSDAGMRYDFDSVWVFFRGASVQLEWLTFGSPEELKRVCQTIYKFNYPGQLSERNGYIVNQLADGSRVVVVRPPFSESWAFFLRKFNVQAATLPQLITGQGDGDREGDGSSFMRQLLSFLIKGARITAVTGAQGAGKTTMLMALVHEIDPRYNIRVQEMSFELRLRAKYPHRNILSFCETDTISGQSGLDIQKKTDGTVNIIGEVATDSVAAWMIQAAQVASLFTLFTHHAKTFPDLVQSLRNSLLKTGVFSDERMAQEQVVHVLHMNVHLNRRADGVRYIERVTECVPVSPGGDRNEERMYETREIAAFDGARYVPGAPLSAGQRQHMSRYMSAADADLFRQFVARYWPESQEAG